MNKRGILYIAIGLLLLAAALLLTMSNLRDSSEAGTAAEEAAEALHELLPAELRPEAVRYIYEPKQKEDAPVPEMAVREEKGYGYIGILEIPSMELSLPIMSEWDYTRLQIAPCAYSGSYYTDDLVLCGHNYKSHFGPLRRLELGAEVFFTTVDGYVYSYRVDNVETVQPLEVKRMTEATDWDLTLFTCHTGGATRCTVRCVRVDGDD